MTQHSPLGIRAYGQRVSHVARLAWNISLIASVSASALTSFPAFAQEYRAAISGRVTDEQRAILPGVLVVATNVNTNAATSSTTNVDGVYTITQLTPGEYRVSAELQGLSKFVREGITLQTTAAERGFLADVQRAGTARADLRSAEHETGSGAAWAVIRDPLPGNVIPTDRINPAARALMRYYPQPNNDSTAVRHGGAGAVPADQALSLFKNTRVGRLTTQLGIEAFNAFNTPVYGGPNTGPNNVRFGQITPDQINFPRQVQIRVRVLF